MTTTLTISFVGWAADKSSVRYLEALKILAETMRHDHAQSEGVPRVHIPDICPARDARELRDQLIEPTDVLLYGGHAGTDGGAWLWDGQKGPDQDSNEHCLYLRDLRHPDGRGIRATGLVLDCCRGGDAAFKDELLTCLDQATAVLACTGAAPYTHGPALMPNLLTQLACPAVPPLVQPELLESAMKHALAATQNAWKRGHLKRWSAVLLEPAPEHAGQM